MPNSRRANQISRRTVFGVVAALITAVLLVNSPSPAAARPSSSSTGFAVPSVGELAVPSVGELATAPVGAVPSHDSEVLQPAQQLGSGFLDVGPEHEFLAHITWLANTGISSGWDDGTFRPNNAITRESMAAFLYRAAGEPVDFQTPIASTFVDVPTSHRFFREIEWLAQSGVTTGWDCGDAASICAVTLAGTREFRPRISITRAAVAAFIYRFHGEPQHSSTESFPDVTSFAHEISWLAETEITTGWPDGTFRPANPVTRAAMAAFLYRGANQVGGGLWNLTGDGVVEEPILVPEWGAVLNPETVVISEDPGDQIEILSITDSAVLFVNEPDFQAGAILVSEAIADAPTGLLRRIVSIAEVSEGWLLETEPAYLTDVFWELDLAVSVDLLSGNKTATNINQDESYAVAQAALNPQNAHRMADGVDSPASAANELLPAAGIDCSFDTDLHLWAAELGTSAGCVTKLGFEFRYPENIAGNETPGQTKISGQVKTGLTLSIAIDIDREGITPVVALFETKAEAVIGLDAQLTNSISTHWVKDVEIPIFESFYVFPTVWIGPVPLVISAELAGAFDATIDLSAEASLQVEYAKNRTEIFGARYTQDGGWTDLRETRKDGSATIDGNLTANANLEMGPTLTANALIWDTAGPEFAAQAQLGLSISYDYRNSATDVPVELYVLFGLDGKVRVQVPATGDEVFGFPLFSAATRVPLRSWCWSLASGLLVGTCGNEDPGQIQRPVPQLNTVSAGSNHSLAIGYDGTVWSWGYWYGVNADLKAPWQIWGLTDIISVAGGGYNSVALRSDGTVWAWGDASYGQLGNGNSQTSSRYRGVQVQGIVGAVAVARGHEHSLAVLQDGTVWAWGRNNRFQLGDGTSDNRYTPVQVQGLNGVVQIAAGYEHSVALREDGSVWAWGANGWGQLGDGTTTYRSYPVQVELISGVTSISAGRFHTIAVQGDGGTVWAWGQNTAQELGFYEEWDFAAHKEPLQIQGLQDILFVSSGTNASHSFARQRDGTVWGWSVNNYGQLGDGTTYRRYTPSLIWYLTNASEIAVGGTHSISTTSDGSIFGMGRNEHGQIGDGTTNDHSIPVKVTNRFSLGAPTDDGEISTVNYGELVSSLITDGEGDYRDLTSVSE